MLFYSVIIPVYDRPDEVHELLDSLVKQTFHNFEVLIVEDGSVNRCQQVVERYQDQLNISYYYKEHSGQGFSRNYGFQQAKGDYFVVFDSDCLIPPHYFEAVEQSLNEHSLDAFGGPDKAHESFTNLQKAISYSMTSPFTTGGIRGNKKHIGTFHPRSFNMGISREVFEKTKGYFLPRMGEDIEFSLRIRAHGFETGLIEEAYVYHKRRTDFKQFYKQLHFFGRARVNVSQFFPRELKLVHTLPVLFTLGLIAVPFSYLIHQWLFILGGTTYLLFGLINFMSATFQNKSILVGVLATIAAFVQLIAYGIGFLTEGSKKLLGK